MSPGDLLLRALRDPASCAQLDLRQWDELLRRARHAGVLSRLALQLGAPGENGHLRPEVRQRLAAAVPVAEQHERIIRWEVDRIQEAVRGLDVKLVLLKGAAYVMAGLPAGRGRLVSDVDVLVPKDRLAEVEHALIEAGWSAVELDPYDERFYRDWSHELPPLRHRLRRNVVDVHHTILPVTGRLHPDPAKLLGAAGPLGPGGPWILAPRDMVLHSATHLFQDGDLAGGVRDLVDLDSLLRHFGAEPGFWDGLAPRATELELTRPLYYALRFCRRLLRTPIPDEVISAAQVGAPPWPVPGVMDRLATLALVPEPDDRRAAGADLARLLLYARSHWLRMPPWRLAGHLTRKAWRRWTGATSE